MNLLISLLFLATISRRPAFAEPICGSTDLRLVQRATWQLPPQFMLAGVVLGIRGSILAWSRDGALVHLGADRSVGLINLPSDLVPAGVGLAADDSQIELIDANPTGPALVRIAFDGASLSRTPLQLASSETILTSAYSAEAWLIGTQDSQSRRFRLWTFTRDGRGRLLYQTAAADSVGGIPRYEATVDRTSWLLAASQTPFTVIRGPLVQGTAEAVDSLPFSAGPTGASWRGLVVVPLDCGSLQTLADLASDQRLLVRYGPTGRVARVSPLEAPFGVAASQTDQRLLAGVRRTGGQEVVLYEWRWLQPADASPEQGVSP